MTPDRLQTAAPFIAAGLLVLALALFLLSLRYFRKSRTDFYWRRRRSAGQRGWRLFVWSLFLTLTSGAICLGTGVAGLLQARSLTPTIMAVASTASATGIPATALPDTPTKTKTPTLTATVQTTIQKQTFTKVATVAATQSATVAPTRIQLPNPTATKNVTSVPATATTATPTSTPGGLVATTIQLRTATHTPTASITFTPSLTFTPSETLVPAIADTPTLQSNVTPSAQATLTITALDTQISADLQPVAPGKSFSAGFSRIYYFVKFSGMQNGVLWRRQLSQDGKLLEDSNYLWGMAQQGTAYFFFGQEDGFKAGQYEIRLYLGQTDKPITTATFTVK